jgi:hypothetical protein
MKGVGPFTHTNPHDRPPEISAAGTRCTVGLTSTEVLHPIIPKAE